MVPAIKAFTLNALGSEATRSAELTATPLPLILRTADQIY